jgi:hypothetical protein
MCSWTGSSKRRLTRIPGGRRCLSKCWRRKYRDYCLRCSQRDRSGSLKAAITRNKEQVRCGIAIAESGGVSRAAHRPSHESIVDAAQEPQIAEQHVCHRRQAAHAEGEDRHQNRVQSFLFQSSPPRCCMIPSSDGDISQDFLAAMRRLRARRRISPTVRSDRFSRSLRESGAWLPRGVITARQHWSQALPRVDFSLMWIGPAYILVTRLYRRFTEGVQFG